MLAHEKVEKINIVHFNILWDKNDLKSANITKYANLVEFEYFKI